MSLIKNPTTGTYLEMARSVGQLFRQGGGSLPFENLTEPGSLGDPGNQFSLKVAGTGTSQPTTPPNTQYSPVYEPDLHFH